ncbi:MAG TPA: universal stress protein [Nitrospiraceae bacterium]|nr:universal stress protein [Nitrospiraceae bacterium]
MQTLFQQESNPGDKPMHIMCAVDGSEFSEWAVQFLEALADRPPQIVTLVHVVDASLIKQGFTGKAAPANRLRAALDKAGTLVLRRMAGMAKASLSQAVTKPHTKIRTLLSHGPIAPTIAREARRHKADLIILGSRGLSDVRGFLLGSVSRKVSTLAPCSILIMKQPVTKLAHVLLAVDGSRHSRMAAGFLSTTLLPESAHVIVISVVEPMVTELAVRYLSATQLEKLLQPRRDKARQLVAEFRKQFLKEGYTVTAEIATDHVIDTILKRVARNNTDLLVAGSRGLNRAERLELGSVSESLLKYAACSVLIVRGAGA